MKKVEVDPFMAALVMTHLLIPDNVDAIELNDINQDFEKNFDKLAKTGNYLCALMRSVCLVYKAIDPAIEFFNDKINSTEKGAHPTADALLPVLRHLRDELCRFQENLHPYFNFDPYRKEDNPCIISDA